MNISEVFHVTPKSCVPLVEDALFTRLVPMLHGSPAIGKSSIVYQIAQKLNLCLIDARMAGFDPTDINGFPVFDHAKGLASYMPMDLFPIKGKALPINPETGLAYAGWLLFLDEFNSAPMAVQAAAYKLILDHKVGMHDLHERCAIVCAGNLDSDGAITNPMSSAMVSRMVHMVVKPSLPEWLEWALQQDGISKKLCSFLEFKPALFYTFDASNPADIYCGPRPLEFASRLMLKRWNDEVPKDKAALMAGTIGEGVTTELRQYLAFFQDLPTVSEVIADPLGTPVPHNPGTLYALDGCLAEWINPDNIKTILKYVDRMPPEHIIVLMRMLVRSQPTIRSNPHFLDWADANADYMIH